LNQRADRSTWWQVNATLHQHLFTHKCAIIGTAQSHFMRGHHFLVNPRNTNRSQAISREEMVQVLLAHINVEVGRISMAAGATDHDKVVHAQSCIPIWLRAHQSLSSALECPQGVIYFGQKK
jgi:predicted secreted protein